MGPIPPVEAHGAVAREAEAHNKFSPGFRDRAAIQGVRRARRALRERYARRVRRADPSNDNASTFLRGAQPQFARDACMRGAAKFSAGWFSESQPGNIRRLRNRRSN